MYGWFSEPRKHLVTNLIVYLHNMKYSQLHKHHSEFKTQLICYIRTLCV